MGAVIHIFGNPPQISQSSFKSADLRKFGGNPNHVVLGGDSAGAGSIDLHLSAYGGRDDGLFHATAAESQSFGAQFTVEGSQYQYDALVERVGCSITTETLCENG